MSRRLSRSIAVWVAATTCACAFGANRGDCAGRIRFQATLYAPNTDLNPSAPVGRAAGRGAVVDCDGKSVVDTVDVHTVDGVTVGDAVIVETGQWQGIYVSESLPESSWPAVLRRQ